MTPLARLVLIGTAIAYAGVGVGFVLAPATLGAFVDLRVETATADNDVRAVYGGVALGLAAFLLLALRRRADPGWVRPALVVALLTLAGMASARLLSWALVGFPAPIGFLLHGAEVTGLVLAALALRGLPAASEESGSAPRNSH